MTLWHFNLERKWGWESFWENDGVSYLRLFIKYGLSYFKQKLFGMVNSRQDNFNSEISLRKWSL